MRLYSGNFRAVDVGRQSTGAAWLCKHYRTRFNLTVKSIFAIASNEVFPFSKKAKYGFRRPQPLN